jgi:hypothetical protein
MSALPSVSTPTTLKPSWIVDSVCQLRIWGTENVYPLSTDAQELTIGTAPFCEIQVGDAWTSRRHAMLTREGAAWYITDRSKNGLSLDGKARPRGFLEPGMKVHLGPQFCLIAESAGSIAVRAALARMVGWRAEFAPAIDRALHILRLAPSGETFFTLSGSGDLFMYAAELHELTLGNQRPIVVCGQKRRGRPAGECAGSDTGESLRRVATGREAIGRARGGTICVDNRRPPHDLDEMFESLQEGATFTQMFMLANYTRKGDPRLSKPFTVPPLSARPSETNRIIAEYEAEAISRWALDPAPEQRLVPRQRELIRQCCATLSDLRKATERLLALHQLGSIAAAADCLRMSKVSLAEWVRARGLLHTARPSGRAAAPRA